MTPSLEKISTQDLLEELEKRKELELKSCVNEINKLLDHIRSFGVEVIYESDDSYSLGELYVENNKPYYTDKY